MTSTKLKTTERKVQLPVDRTIKDLGSLIMQHKDRILDALPRGIDGEAVLKKALMAVRKSPALLRAKPASLFYAIAEATSNGLEIGGHRQHCYLVPFGDEVILILGYKGMIELVRRTGQLESASLNLVHEGDEFEYEEGDNPLLRHIPATDADSQTRPVTHVYVVFRLRGGVVVRNVWTAARVCAHRDQYSESYNRAEAYRQNQEKAGKPVDAKRLSAWHTSWHNQAFKTLIRDLFNRGLLPISEEVQTAIQRDTFIENAKEPPVTRDRTLDDMLAGIMKEPTQNLLSQSYTPDGGDFEVDGTPVSSEPEPMTTEERELTLELRLKAATSLGAVSAIREAALAMETDEDQRAYVVECCAMRDAEIREGRST